MSSAVHLLSLCIAISAVLICHGMPRVSQFLTPDGQVIRYHGPDGQVPVFINEAAYGEKGIALSLTVRETWPLTPQASEALSAVLALGDQRGTPL